MTSPSVTIGHGYGHNVHLLSRVIMGAQYVKHVRAAYTNHSSGTAGSISPVNAGREVGAVFVGVGIGKGGNYERCIRTEHADLASQTGQGCIIRRRDRR